MSWLWRAARGHLTRLIVAGVLAAAAELAGLGLLATATWLLVSAAGQPPLAALTVAIVSVRALAIGRGTLRYAERLTGHDAVLRILADVRERLYTALVARRPDAAGPRSADLLSRMVSDVDAVQDLVLRVLVPVGAAGAVAVAAVGVTSVLAPAATGVVAAGLLVAGVVLPVWAVRGADRAARAVAPLRARLAVEAVDLSHGVADLAAYGAIGAATGRLRQAAEGLARQERRLATTSSAVTAVGTLTAGLTAAGAVLLAVRAGVDPVAVAVVGVGALVAVESCLGLVAAARTWAEVRAPLARLTAVLTGGGGPAPDRSAVPDRVVVSDQAAALDRVVAPDRSAVLDRVAAPDLSTVADRPAAPDPVAAGDPPAASDRPAAPGVATVDRPAAPGVAALDRPAASVERTPGPVEISARGLTVRYPDRSVPALSDVDLDLRPGVRVAVVGPSGAGKSTLLAALLGLVTPTAGTLTVGGVPPAAYPEEQRRRLVSGLLADAHLFHTTVRANLRLADPDADDAALVEACRVAGLGPWLAEQPDGLDTVVGEDGGQLSGGERQRLALARALLAAPAVLVLDEPTEGLAPDAAAEVLRNVLAAVGPDRSVLVVTHDLRGLAGFDEIIVLEQGRVRQRGSHAEVVDQDGWYREQYLAQRLAYEGYLPAAV